jgi:NAD(P)-dependent dehydrogenase (short-subunit alcohol dehydrogenase family)
LDSTIELKNQDTAMELQNKTAFITGGASGLGLATARNFVAQGANVLLYDLNAELLERVAAELGSSASWQVGDVTDESQRQLRKLNLDLARYISMLIVLALVVRLERLAEMVPCLWQSLNTLFGSI